MVDEAAALGLPLRLSVLTTNPAQAFYRREGFREIKRDQERVRFEAGNV
jgi:ribosomal protein S18 acetylase RimI-like enzyme